MNEFGIREDGKSYENRHGAYGLILRAGRVLILEVEGEFFLPGGGMSAGENAESCLRREIMEEIGFNVVVGNLLAEAAQYLFSYREQRYFKKVGAFYICELAEKIGPPTDSSHRIIWEYPEAAIEKLSQEFQSWAIQQMAK